MSILDDALRNIFFFGSGGIKSSIFEVKDGKAVMSADEDCRDVLLCSLAMSGFRPWRNIEDVRIGMECP